MKKINLFFILLSFFRSSIGMQQPTPAQLVQQAVAELPKIREELGKPINPNQGQPAQGTAQPNIDVHKRRLQGEALNRICNAVSGGQERLHAQRTAQEAIAHAVITTAAAQEAACHERLNQKVESLSQAQSNREAAEGQLGTLQEIQQKQAQQKQKKADLEKACKDLQFLREIKALDDKLYDLNNHLSSLDLEISREIMAAQALLRTLKQS